MMQLDVEQLLIDLTLLEKISLLAGLNSCQTVKVDRLNIPEVRVSDGPNGVRGTRFFNSIPSNCFPCGTGMASTFNKDLLLEAGKLMCKEAKMKSIHCILGPTCNIARGPLGGRTFESYSEDPVLSGIMSAAIINGIQLGNVVACLKHFVCNDQEEDRNGVDTIVTERALREVYLKPFQIAVRDANPGAMMIAFNKVNGEHVSQDKTFLQDVLRKEWKWDGLTMSDWFGTYTTKQALEAGLNLEMPGPTRMRQEVQTSHMVVCNEIHRDVIDDNVRHVLKFINNCLMAEIPDDFEETENTDPAASTLLRQIAGESLVLLKNEDNILPLSPENEVGNELIAVIGPNARAERNSGGGSASIRTRYTITPFEGILNKVKERAGDNAVIIEHSLGAYLDKTMPDIGNILTRENGEKGFTIKFFREPRGSPNRGEPFDVVLSDSTKMFLTDYSSSKLPAGTHLFYADIEGYFTPEETSAYEFGCSCLGTAQMFVDDELVVDNKTHQVKGDAFFLGLGTREEKGQIDLEKGKKYKLRVEFGTSPTSKLLAGVHDTGGVFFGAQIKTTDEVALEKALDLAKRADKVVLVAGLCKDWESEGYDRKIMEVPGWTDKLIAEVCKVNQNVIVVNQSGSPISMPWINKVKALVHAWYGGNELGNAIADVLFGDVNPSGKLSLTFPEKLEHNPSFLNFGSTNSRVLYGEDVFVGYKYYEKVDRKPLFPFGFGLSYTTFAFNNIQAVIDGDHIVANLDVSNTGEVDGAEVVQLYVKPQNPSIIRPVKELRDFGKVFLKSGETKTLTLKTSLLEATSYWDSYQKKWLSEKDTYTIILATSSDKVVGQSDITTVADKFWLGL
ncbi:CIC11C00000000336 [Sungouiella intermedia]|uniref:beta-glucosidase n=1 Tax=Sungouiella intermedia TaxID=45354 RepID=A0A1L0BL81_9ASCO|nr:CIC11C00000000336 [[Candida] intermedia]